MSQGYDKLLDARRLNCPMPLVNARKELGKLDLGRVLKVLSTDRGSLADFQGWAKVAKNMELIAQETEPMDGETVYVHYVKRTA